MHRVALQQRSVRQRTRQACMHAWRRGLRPACVLCSSRCMCSAGAVMNECGAMHACARACAQRSPCGGGCFRVLAALHRQVAQVLVVQLQSIRAHLQCIRSRRPCMHVCMRACGAGREGRMKRATRHRVHRASPQARPGQRRPVLPLQCRPPAVHRHAGPQQQQQHWRREVQSCHLRWAMHACTARPHTLCGDSMRMGSRAA